MRPPELSEFIDAVYPVEELQAGREVEVVLSLVVDASGRVASAEVAQSAGESFDRAALSAAHGLGFTPARRGDQAVAARILFRYLFRPPAPAPSPPDSARPAVETHASSQQRSSAGKISALGGASVLRAAAPATEEVIIHGLTRADEMRLSAEAVQVVETRRDQQRSADLGEVLARSAGIQVRRAGGLGSGSRFFLQGLTDDQVRFFIDGVPLELAGYLTGVANLPVGQVQHVEVFRGVVPVRFGADALGGAVNLVTDQRLAGTHASASYQVGSYGTYRLSAAAQHRHEPNGVYARVNGFFDHAKNDYPVRGKVPQTDGSQIDMRVRRLHDAYRASQGSLEIGVVNKPWAKRLSLRGFVAEFEKELQHNIVMTVPYHEVTFGKISSGAQARYSHSPGRRVGLDVVLTYAHAAGWFKDLGRCTYSWLGRCLSPLDPPGEIDAPGRDGVYRDNTLYGLFRLNWRASEQHGLRIAVSSTGVVRDGEDRLKKPEDRDPLAAERQVLSLVSGAEYEFATRDRSFENIAFAKQYTQILRSEEPLVRGQFRRRDRNTVRFGVGNSLRYRMLNWLYGKASYEFATRLPNAEEIFGDAALVGANLELKPETSHNVNVGLSVLAEGLSSGSFRAELSTFLRDTDQLIVRLGNESQFRYQNVYAARSLGAEAAVSWTSPKELLWLTLNGTYVDLRNASGHGTFGEYEGDRVPNRPYLFGNAGAELRLMRAEGHELSLSSNSRYVHSYLRSWESLGSTGTKQQVPSQLVHSAALTYVLRRPLTVSSSFEVQNLTDAEAYDFFWVRRPGRTYFFKGTAEF